MLQVANLRVENQTEPFALGEPNPSFSWNMVSDRRAARQLAYRVCVLRDGEILFDTEQVTDETCMGVRYAGEPLRPLTEYVARVEDRKSVV